MLLLLLQVCQPVPTMPAQHFRVARQHTVSTCRTCACRYIIHSINKPNSRKPPCLLLHTSLGLSHNTNWLALLWHADPVLQAGNNAAASYNNV